MPAVFGKGKVPSVPPPPKTSEWYRLWSAGRIGDTEGCLVPGSGGISAYLMYPSGARPDGTRLAGRACRWCRVHSSSERCQNCGGPR